MGQIIFKFIRQIIRLYNRARLKNTNPSIICQNCIGGVIYHELGLPFLSPTINLWMDEKDFYKFAQNLKHYLSMELRFVIGIDTTPTAWCDDILIHFNHYKSEQDAANKWYDRCKRINWDNIWLICSDRWSVSPDIIPTEEDIRSLKDLPVKGQCVFAVKNYNGIDYIHHLRKDPDGDYVYPLWLISSNYCLSGNGNLNLIMLNG